MGYVNFPKMERNWGRVLKFKDCNFVTFLGLFSQFGLPSLELHQVGEPSGSLSSAELIIYDPRVIPRTPCFTSGILEVTGQGCL